MYACMHVCIYSSSPGEYKDATQNYAYIYIYIHIHSISGPNKNSMFKQNILIRIFQYLIYIFKTY